MSNDYNVFSSRVSIHVTNIYHYFSCCNNDKLDDKLVNLRENFLKELSEINSSFK
jgi:hypothetical protein